MKSILSLIAMVLLCGNAAADYKVPNQSCTESIFGGTGDRGKAEAYADAMQLAKPPFTDVTERQWNMYIASLKLANVQYETKHRRVLLAVAISWHERGVTNPVGARLCAFEEGMSLVTEEELDKLYLQVLVEQGLVAGDEPPVGSPAPVWAALNR